MSLRQIDTTEQFALVGRREIDGWTRFSAFQEICTRHHEQLALHFRWVVTLHTLGLEKCPHLIEGDWGFGAQGARPNNQQDGKK